jgi:hypothetical protein
MSRFTKSREIRAHYDARRLFLEWRAACRKARALRLEMEAEKFEEETQQLREQEDAEVNSLPQD